MYQYYSFYCCSVQQFLSVAWGGSNDSSVDSEQTESLTEDTGETGETEDTGDYDPNDEGRARANTIRVRTTKTNNYHLYSQKFFACKSGGSWERLIDEQDGNQTIYISDEYVGFGFEFCINDGANWPYSGIFWTEEDSEQEKVTDIRIAMAGTANSPSLNIFINSQNIYSQSNMSSGERYTGWGDITLEITRTGFELLEQRLYARKSNTAEWEVLVDDTDVERMEITGDYVEFGFEFDVDDGVDWPYSNVFWTASASAKDKPRTIIIAMSGEKDSPNLSITVNGRKAYSGTGLGSGEQYYWKKTWKGIRVSVADNSSNIDMLFMTRTKVRNFYARKAGGAWEKKYEHGNSTTFYLSYDYVEFGFEFQTYGVFESAKWLYSDVFWTADDTEMETPSDIRIELGEAKLSIYVNDSRVYYDEDCGETSRYSW